MRASRKRSTESRKLLQCELGVEAEDARAEHALEQLVAPRTDAEALRVRPRDVPEHEDRRARQPLADQPRREREVVVLHQDDRVVASRPPRRPRRRTCWLTALVVLPVLARGRSGARARGGRAARGPRWRSRSSSPSPPRSVSQTRRSRYDSSPGGTRTRSCASTVSRSAEPLPCATQTPEQARITGSSAVTRPLAGCSTAMPPSVVRSWMYGSRLARITTFSPCR